MGKDFDVMEACSASALDFIDTVLFCMKEDDFEDDVIDCYKEYLLAAHKMHYDSDIGEQCENIEKYLDECNYYNEDTLTLLQEVGNKIEEWLKEAGYTDGCIDAAFEPVEGHQGRAMCFEYNKNIEQLDVDKLKASISENVIDDRFSVKVCVCVYDDEDGEAYKNVFCVEVWLNN